jgi:hypothetical protein
VRDAQTQGEHAERAFEAAWEGESAELTAQLEALDTDHLRSLVEVTEALWRTARALWVQRTTQPRRDVR